MITHDQAKRGASDCGGIWHHPRSAPRFSCMTAVVCLALVATLGCGPEPPPRFDATTDGLSATEPAAARAAHVARVQARATPEHDFAATGGGRLAAACPAQRLRAEVTRGGLHVAVPRRPGGQPRGELDRNPEAHTVQVSLQLAAIGRRGQFRVPVGQPMSEPVALGNRATLEHAGGARRGGITEYYVVGPLGIEQGFVVAEPPQRQREVDTVSGDRARGPTAAFDGPPASGQLVLALRVVGLDPVLADGGSWVSLQTVTGQPMLRYSDLFVTDATGSAVDSWMVVEGGQLLLVIDDRLASYPLRIDPLVWAEQDQLLPSDAGSLLGSYGCSVSIAADTALIGDEEASFADGQFRGAAFVFVRAASSWSEQAKLAGTEDAVDDGDEFGNSVSVLGDTALVGAPETGVGNDVGRGAAYVFVRSAQTWSEQATLLPSDGGPGHTFGQSVSLHGETALVGSGQEAAYVFVRSAQTWSEQAKLVASDTALAFGWHVAVFEDTAIVTAVRDAVGLMLEQGSAYVFVRSAQTWSEQAKLVASDGELMDHFGHAVSLAGDTALVGALWHDVADNTDQGAAYVFVRSAQTWSEQATLVAAEGGEHDWFGYSVSLSGDNALVGARQHDVEGSPSQGGAFVFTRSASAWSQQIRFVAADGAEGDMLGKSVAIDSDTAVVGANNGAAYVFGFGNENGDPCVASGECASGDCVDGVCCDGPCGDGHPDDCLACSVAAGAPDDGTCAPRTDGADCDDGIACNGADTCDDGQCSVHTASCGGQGGAGGTGSQGGGAAGGVAGGPPSADSASDGGCGCRVQGLRPARHGPAWAGLAYLGLVCLRRRRCRASPRTRRGTTMNQGSRVWVE